MKPITLPVAELKPALTGLGKLIARKPKLPILGGVLINRDPEGWVTLTGTDLDSFATLRLEQPQEGEPESILIPCADLGVLAKGCAATDAITVQAAGEHAALRYPIGSSSFSEKRIQSFPVAEFPVAPEINAPEHVLESDVRTALLDAMQCASTDATRYVINGAFIDVSGKGHYIVATDGRQLFASNSFKLPLAKSLIVPDHRFLAWKPFAQDGEWRMRVQPGTTVTIELSSRRWRFVARAIDGNYPNWRQVLPDPEKHQASVQLSPEAVEAASRMIPRMPCHDPVNGTIGLKIVGGDVTLRARGGEDADWTELGIEARATGADVTVYLNRKYLLRALQFGLKEIRIIDAMSPIRFVSEGRQMIVMPIQVKGPVPAVPEAAEPKANTEPEPAAQSPTQDSITKPTERKPMAQNTNGNSNGNGTHRAGENGSDTPNAPALELALGQTEEVREALKTALSRINSLLTTLKAAQREQRTADREVQSVRQTLEKIQSVRL